MRRLVIEIDNPGSRSVEADVVERIIESASARVNQFKGTRISLVVDPPRDDERPADPDPF